MDLEVAGICLIVLFAVFISLPQAIYIRLKAPLSLRYVMSGVIGTAAQALVVFGHWRGADVTVIRGLIVFAIDYREWSVLLGMGLLSPLWFSIGARRSLREVGSHRAKVLRWVNVVGFALSVGLIVMLLMRYALKGYYSPRYPSAYYSYLLPLTTAAVLVLAFSRLVLWQPPTRSRWAGFLPRYPAILLMPAVLVVWVVLCTYTRGTYNLWPKTELASGWVGKGFPLPFYAMWWGPGHVYAGFRLTPYLVDLLLAVVVAWVLAWGTDRPVQKWAVLSLRFRRVLRWMPSIRFRWPKFLPRFPAILLMFAILWLWVTLCTIPRKDSERYQYSDYSAGAVQGVGKGFPFIFVGSKLVPGSVYRDYGFMPVEFLIDLIIALAAAYLLAMGVERLCHRSPKIGHHRSLQNRPF
ncbi:MAG: hypothetical protein O7H41_16165 [Planctomycetota bacterium]|nr:hypothetical protein [Planctomycetota bacterium]